MGSEMCIRDRAQIVYLAPGPPSSQSPSEARLHVSVQRSCALVRPTILRADQVKSSQNATPATKPNTSHVLRELLLLL